MARPVQLQKLRHGRILSGGATPHFVETWNWLVAAFDNLKGDADVNPKNGHISIDRSDPDCPVVRLSNLNGLGGATPSGVYLYDVEWDATNHALVKKYKSFDGNDAPVPSDVTSPIATTAISDIVSSGSSGS